MGYGDRSRGSPDRIDAGDDLASVLPAEKKQCWSSEPFNVSIINDPALTEFQYLVDGET